jgi:hypothetical protein
MTEPIQINISGEKVGFHFNNYALIELGKLCQCDPIESGNKIMELAADDVFTSLAFIIQAGRVGYEKANGNVFHGLNVKDILKYIGSASPEELNSLNSTWESFKEASGVSEFIENLPQPEETEDSKKK